MYIKKLHKKHRYVKRMGCVKVLPISKNSLFAFEDVYDPLFEQISFPECFVLSLE